MKNLSILMCLAFAVISQIFTEYVGGAYMLYALGLGILLAPILYNEKTKQGVEYTGKKILRIGVALLGARITFNEISMLGFDVLVAITLSVFATIAFGIIVARALGLSNTMGTISGGSVAICGASAALAVSSIFPQNKQTENQTIFIVIAVNILSTVAMVLYPVIANYMEYNGLQSGVFLGGSIHDVAQVVGAGFSMSDEVGNFATITKLFRVALLLPVVFALAIIIYMLAKKSNTDRIHADAPFPMFLLGFLALVGLNSFGLLSIAVPAIDWQLNQTIAFISKIFLTMAVFALGLKTSFKAMLDVGGKSIVLVVLETIFIAILIIAIATYMV